MYGTSFTTHVTCALMAIVAVAVASPTAQAAEVLTFAWSGGVTDTSASVVCQTTSSSNNVTLVVSSSPGLGSPVYSSPAVSTDANRIARFDDVSGLSPNTVYYYGIKVNGTLDTALNDSDNGSNPYTGRFTTMPTRGSAHSFKVTLGSCLRTGDVANEDVFDTMKNENPLFWMSTGDFHYGDVRGYDPADFRGEYLSRLISGGNGTKLASLSRRTAFVYTWDDHDFGPDDSHGAGVTNSYKQAAHEVYRQLVPAHDFGLAGDSSYVAGYEPIAHAFTVGRVRFIVCDLRSESTPGDTSNDTLLGTRQKEWFKQELLKANGRHAFIVWVSSVPWNGGAKSSSSDGDRWQYFPEERRELADFIHEHQINGLLVASGDMHGCAIDDGSNADFTTGNVGDGFVIFQASPLSNAGSYKAGPYSEGANDSGGTKYGLLDFNISSGAASLTLTAKNENAATITANRDNVGNPITYTMTNNGPLLLSTLPADGSSSIATSANLALNFSENVFAGTGTLELRRKSNGTLVQSYSATSGAVNISGTQITVDLPTLSDNTEYSISISEDFVRDNVGNPNASMRYDASTNLHSWTFNTGDAPNQPPTANFSMSPSSGDAPLVVSFNGNASSDPEGGALNYAWDFGDGNTGSGATTSHTFTTPGTYTVTLTVTDPAGSSDSTTRSLSATDPNATSSKPASMSDDAEEHTTGTMDINSTDLELVDDLNGHPDQKIGIRFPNLTIPQGATITAASIEFTVDETSSTTTDLVFRAQFTGNAPTFTTTSGDISSRSLTAASASWSPGSWSSVGAKHTSADLSAVIQEVVNRGDWNSGNAIAIIITGSGRRVAESYDGSPSDAPILTISFDSNPGDTEAPSTPDNLSATGISQTAIDLSWNASTDNVGVDHYVVRRDGAVIASNVTGTSFSDTGLTAATAYSYTVVAVDAAGNESAQSIPASATTDSAGGQSPYGGVAWSVPGRIEAEDYDDGGSLIAYSDNDVGNNGGVYRSDDVDIQAATDGSGALYIGYIRTGEWLEYTVNVAAAGTYDLDLRVARSNPDSRTMHVEVNGEDVTGVITIPSTGGWQTWTTVTVNDVTLAAGEQVLRLAFDSGYYNLDWFELIGTSVSTSSQPAASSDDAEEYVSGAMSLTSSDLELVMDDFDRGDQQVGIRFPNLAIPQGATITSASIDFTVDEAHSDATDLVLRAQLSGNAPTFTTSSGNISGRALTSASTAWSPGPWSSIGAVQTSPDLAAVIQEVVNQGAWNSGNALAIIITGTGRRTAVSYDNAPIDSPLLNVTYTIGSVGSRTVSLGSIPGYVWQRDGQTGTESGDEEIFDGLDPDTDHTFVPTPSGGG